MRNKEELIEFAKQKFGTLSRFDMQYYSTYWMDETEDEYENAYDSLYSMLDNVDWIAHGVSKLVIAFKDEPDYVFKIPFHGGKIVDYNDDPSDYVDDDYVYIYSHANQYDIKTLSNWDYCGIEEYVYKQAVKWDVENLFANTFFLMDIVEPYLDFRIYASCKIKTTSFYESNKNISDASKKEASDISKNSIAHSHPISDNMLAAFVEDYGYDVANQFFDFLNTLNVRDLHGDNVGFDTDGKAKVLDYSSFSHEDLC